MLDLKPYFDAINEADAEVQRVANEIHVLFTDGTDESKVKALELRPALEKAQQKHAEAVGLYETMQKANRPNDVAKNFVPVSTELVEAAKDPNQLNKSAFLALEPSQRMAFVKRGGRVLDDEPTE